MGDAFITRRGITPEPQLIIDTGLIVEWYGLSSVIPEGWALCDGANGTPNLRDKFIVGGGDTYAIGATGGSANAIVPSHSHTASNTNTVGNHTHGYRIGRSSINSSGNEYSGRSTRNDGSFNVTSGGGHSHSSTVSTVGTSATNANLPPYYGLFYIIKVEA